MSGCLSGAERGSFGASVIACISCVLPRFNRLVIIVSQMLLFLEK
jgi:hypothetical protein